MSENFEIYRDCNLDKWATYKRQIVPKTIKFMNDGQEAFTELGGQLRSLHKTLSEHMYKVANS